MLAHFKPRGIIITTPASADTVPVADPIASPDVTDTRLLPDPDRPTTHTTAVSDTHAVLSQDVNPDRIIDEMDVEAVKPLADDTA